MISQSARRARLEGQVAAVCRARVKSVDGREDGIDVFARAGRGMMVCDDVGAFLRPERLKKAENLRGLGEAVGTGGVETGDKS